MILPSIFVLCIFSQLNFIASSIDDDNFTYWTEDDYLETPFPIHGKFIFNDQRYENLLLRTRMNQWSLELSYGNRSHFNRIWTELHLFFNPRLYSAALNYSIQGYVHSQCDRPIISPLTNDSTFSIPELFDIDQRIAKYFPDDGFFRTINYIHCTIDDRRLDPLISIQLDIYFVTNREFQSLIYIEMPDDTQKLLAQYQTRFYLHSQETEFRYNFNIDQINYPLNSDTSLVHMIKLYNQTVRVSSDAMTILRNFPLMFLNLFFFFHHF